MALHLEKIEPLANPIVELQHQLCHRVGAPRLFSLVLYHLPILRYLERREKKREGGRKETRVNHVVLMKKNLMYQQ